MISNIKDVSTAIDILIRFISLYDKVVAESFSLLLNPITQGDIDGGLIVLKRRLCQATDHKETTNEETTNDETTNDETTNDETTNDETTNEETTNDETTNDENEETTTNDGTTNDGNEETNDEDEETNDENDETTNDENEETNNENDETADNENEEIQEIFQDPDSKFIYESFRQKLDKSATDFISTYSANPEHFWNKLPLLEDGHIVSQLLKVLDHHSEMSHLAQRLLEIKLYEQVQLLENAFVESNSALRKGETVRSVALQRVLGHKPSRAEDFKVDRGKKLSNFELIDLFRISKPHWIKWRKIKLSKVEMIHKNLRPVQAECAKDLADVLSKVYKHIPSQTPFIPERREGEAQTTDSEVENTNLPILSFSPSADPVDSQGDSLEGRNDETLDKEPSSNSAEATTSNKRSACDLYPLAAKKQCLGQVALPSQGRTAEPDPLNDRTVHPSNDNSARPGSLDISPLRDFGAQSNPAIDYQAVGCSLSDNSAAINFSLRNPQRDSFSRASNGTPRPHDEIAMPQGQIQLFEAQARSRQPSPAPVVDNSIYPDDYNIGPDSIDAIIASAEPRVPWPTGVESYDADPGPIDAITASAEPRVPWPTGVESYDADPGPIDAITASAEPRVPWPTSYDIVPDSIDAIIASAEPRVPWPTIDGIDGTDLVEGGAYQWSPPNQYSIAAT
ncbi:uncharacterized protein BDV17DRAFT_166965 [Aspergillus undulatus]|uniref:uncharacterized protein n=1 Tax=Aspergillus undulatus TaxID=1810928 RepID=UPI003CCCBB72